MKIIEDFIKIKEGVLKGRNLKKTLINVLSSVEEVKGNVQLSKLFEIIGDELQKGGMHSIVCVIDDLDDEMIVRSINFPGGFGKVFTTENVKKQDFNNFRKYKEVIKNKKAVFCEGRLSRYRELFPELEKYLENEEECNSIIAPLVLRGELIGTLEILSPWLDRSDLELVETFVDKLLIGITNNILFYEAMESEKRYRRLFQNSSDGLVFFDLKKRKFKESNQAMQKILGYNEKEIRELVYEKLFMKEDWRRIENIIERARAGYSTNKLPLKLCTKIKANNGEIKICDIEVGEQSGKEELYIKLNDVTDQKKMERALRESEEKYRLLVDNAEDGVMMIGADARVSFLNKAVCRIFSREAKDILGVNFLDFVNEADKEMVADTFNNRMLELETISNYDFRINLPDKQERYINYSGVLVKKDNEKIGVQVIIRDISEKKRDEEERRRLTEFNQKILDASPASIIVIDNNGIIISSNGLAKKLLSKEKNNLLGERLTDTKEIAGDDDLKKCYERLLKNGQSFYYDNLSYISSRSGRKKYMNIIAVPLYDKDGKVDGAVSMAIDNTEKVIAKQRLIKLNADLERKVASRTEELDKINKELSKVLELKSKFISDASHELRTPLTVIQGNLDLARQEGGTDNKTIGEALSIIAKEVSQMTEILSDLTMLTNTDASSETLNYDTVDINLVGAAVTQSMKVLARQKGIHLKFISEEEDVSIIGDENKLEKLLLNIVRNAIKYTENDGYVELRIKKEADAVKMIVKDTGIGIPEMDLPYIFERFYRVDKARSRNEGGTGLGLSICKWIAEAHGGSITVESRLGSGTVFSVSLPYDCRK
jgi:PAS domain S-box-containing protein